MKRLLSLIVAAAFSLSALGATLVPVQLLNPTGSTSGQTIISTGGSTAPSWSTMVVADVSGAAALTGATFTGGVGVSYSNPVLAINDTSSTNSSQLIFSKGASSANWAFFSNSSTGVFTLNRYNSGTFQDSPISVSNSTGIVTMLDGVSGTPISGSTGSFTTVIASSTITPSQTSGIVGTTTNNNANTGSVGEYLTGATASTSLTTVTPANCASVPLSAGDWDVQGVATYNPNASTTISSFATGISTTSATFGAANTGSYVQQTATFSTGNANAWATPVLRISLASSGTAYLVGQAGFAVSTMTCAGFIRARRIR